MQIDRNALKVARILHEDGEFATLEMGKTDRATFHLQQNDEGETVGGDKFLTFIAVRVTDGGTLEVWDPWE